MRNSVPSPGVLRNLHLAAHQVGQHAGDGQADAAAAGLHACCRATKGSKMRSSSAAGMPGPVSRISKTAISRRHSTLNVDAAAHGEFDGVAQHVDQDLAQALLVGAHHRRQSRRPAGRRRTAPCCAPAVRTCRRSAAGNRGNPAARTSSVSLPPSMRAMSSVPSMTDSRWSPLSRMTLTACLRLRRHVLVGIENLRIAEDAVERRAQFVADRRDVAALGLVGLLGDLRGLSAVPRRCAGAIRFPASAAGSGGSIPPAPPRRLLLGQHHPPGADAGEQQQRGKGLDEAVLQRGDQHRLAAAPRASSSWVYSTPRTSASTGTIPVISSR